MIGKSTCSVFDKPLIDLLPSSQAYQCFNIPRCATAQIINYVHDRNVIDHISQQFVCSYRS